MSEKADPGDQPPNRPSSPPPMPGASSAALHMGLNWLNGQLGPDNARMAASRVFSTPGQGIDPENPHGPRRPRRSREPRMHPYSTDFRARRNILADLNGTGSLEQGLNDIVAEELIQHPFQPPSPPPGPVMPDTREIEGSMTELSLTEPEPDLPEISDLAGLTLDNK